MNVEVRTVVRGSPATVWRALVEDYASWWSYLELDARVGGHFVERWRDASGEARVTTGEVLSIVAQRRLELTWRDDNWCEPTLVRIYLDPVLGGVEVTVTHQGWEA